MPARCAWPGNDPLLIEYHDREWGVPVRDDSRMFEFLTLESAQAGLSWLTVLRRREGYRRAFAGFDPERVACFGEEDIARLLADPGIIRNRLKVRAAVDNAWAFLRVRDEFGSFCEYIWGFVGGKPKINAWSELSRIPAVSAESDALSRDLKKRGFRFMGSTIIYAHMQAAGLVNDHTTDCFRYRELAGTR